MKKMDLVIDLRISEGLIGFMWKRERDERERRERSDLGENEGEGSRSLLFLPNGCLCGPT